MIVILLPFIFRLFLLCCTSLRYYIALPCIDGVNLGE